MNKRIHVLLVIILIVLPIIANEQAVRRVRYPGGKCYMYRLAFKDKSGTPYSIDKPQKFLSEKSIERRKRQGVPIDSTDLPISPAYISQLENMGVTIASKSKWNNSVWVRSQNIDLLISLTKLKFVKSAIKAWTSPDSITIKYKAMKSGDAKKAIEYTKDELLKIQCMLELGQVQDAYNLLKELPEELKTSPRYFTLQAQYCYSAKDFEKALAYIEEYDKVSPNSPLTYQMRALVYDECGDAYHAHINWGKYNILRHNNDIAVNEFLNAVQLDDSDIDVLFNLAALLIDNGEIDHAAEYYEKIVKHEPGNKEALKKLADYREGLGDYKMQVAYLEKIVETNPKDLPALKDLAKAYEKNHANAKAIETYNKYLELVKDPVDYKMAKERLDKLDSHSDDEESVGLLDKIMEFFNKNK